MSSVTPAALLDKGCKMKVGVKCHEGGWASGHMAREGFSKEEGTKQSYQEVKDTEETECSQEAKKQQAAGVQNLMMFGGTSDSRAQALELETEAGPESSCLIPSLCGQAIMGVLHVPGTVLHSLQHQTRQTKSQEGREGFLSQGQETSSWWSDADAVREEQKNPHQSLAVLRTNATLRAPLSQPASREGRSLELAAVCGYNFLLLGRCPLLQMDCLLRHLS